jgi:subtilisin family serine protease
MKIVSSLCVSLVLLSTTARSDPTSESYKGEGRPANGGLRGSSAAASETAGADADPHRHLFEPGAAVARVWIQFKEGKERSECIESIQSMVVDSGAVQNGAIAEALVTPDQDKPNYSTQSFGGSAAPFQMHFDYFDLETQSIVASVDKNMLSALAADPDVVSIGRDEKRYFYGAVDKTPVPEGEQRRLQASETIPTGINLVQAPSVWALGYKGTGVKVCIIDSGIDKGHPEYAALNMTGVTTSAGTWNTDGHGHGTHCAGTVGAGQNGVGVVGVAPEATIVPLKVFDNDGDWAYSSWVVSAAVECQNQGANIVSMSLGSTYYSSYEHDVFTTLHNQGVVSIAAAGNSGDATFSYPASYDVVLSVAATHSSKAKADFSQFNSLVDIAAPGVSVLSSVPRASVTNGYPYQYWSGTSMATPHVAGVAALLRQKNPTASASAIMAAITSTAEDLGAVGRDDVFGHGFVRALDAFNSLPFPPTNAPTNAPTTAPPSLPTTKAPTSLPTGPLPTSSPTVSPSEAPTSSTKAPTVAPTKAPTRAPTKKPTKKPTKTPTKKPTKRPTRFPTKRPVKQPTKKPVVKTPTKRPRMAPTKRPRRQQRRKPST